MFSFFQVRLEEVDNGFMIRHFLPTYSLLTVVPSLSRSPPPPAVDGGGGGAREWRYEGEEGVGGEIVSNHKPVVDILQSISSSAARYEYRPPKLIVGSEVRGTTPQS